MAWRAGKKDLRAVYTAATIRTRHQARHLCVGETKANLDAVVTRRRARLARLARQACVPSNARPVPLHQCISNNSSRARRERKYFLARLPGLPVVSS